MITSPKIRHQNDVTILLNPDFRPFSFELKKIRFFEINFDQGFKSSVTSDTENI